MTDTRREEFLIPGIENHILPVAKHLGIHLRWRSNRSFRTCCPFQLTPPWSIIAPE
jgi:hypothetical protein